MKGKAQPNPDEDYKQTPTGVARDALETLQEHIEAVSNVGAELESISKLFRLFWDYSGNGGGEAAEEFLADILEERGAKLANLGGKAERAIGTLSKTISGAEAQQ